MKTMKLGSLFDGSGGFPLTASLCGITPVWASEIEPYPIAVTRNRFPEMKHLGNVSTINGADIEPVDIITFGSPCQDMSMAGRRDGLGGKRSSLFYEAVRIIKEMRCATGGRYPRYIVWENVPGAFSSNRGEDFKAVLEAVIGIVEPNAKVPMPEKARWPYADLYMGDGWSVAYRTLDAQYWGVPQRRRRIYLVADFTGRGAGKILFEREGLQGHFTEGRTPWETVSRSFAPRTGAASNLCLNDQGGGRMECSEGVAPTLRAEAHGHQPCVLRSAGFCPEVSAKTRGIGWGVERSPTLRAGAVPAVNVQENHSTAFAQSHKDRATICYSTSKSYYHTKAEKNLAETLVATDYKDPPTVAEGPQYIVRRLTPTECARLQGFPDEWGEVGIMSDFSDTDYQFWLGVRNTYATINGKAIKDYTKPQMLTWYNKLHTDGAEYKMWGNGIALPTALYVMQGIADYSKDKKEADYEA